MGVIGEPAVRVQVGQRPFADLGHVGGPDLPGRLDQGGLDTGDLLRGQPCRHPLDRPGDHPDVLGRQPAGRLGRGHRIQQQHPLQQHAHGRRGQPPRQAAPAQLIHARLLRDRELAADPLQRVHVGEQVGVARQRRPPLDLEQVLVDRGLQREQALARRPAGQLLHADDTTDRV